MALTRQVRYTAAAFTSLNPTLNAGWLGIETDTGKFKIGDGTTAWTSLTYFITSAGVDAAIAAATLGLYEHKGSTDCSSNPNYPVGAVGDVYLVSVAGKIGGASGKTVEVGDKYVCDVANAGGTEAAVGTSWTVLQGNISSASALLDTIGSTRGSVLYRGATGWAVLAPGTSTHVLTSNGAGADPSYQAAGGGGDTLTMLDPASTVEMGPLVAQAFTEYDFGTLLGVSGIKAVILTLQFYVTMDTARATIVQRGIRFYSRPADSAAGQDGSTLRAGFETTHYVGTTDEAASIQQVTVKCATVGGDANKADISVEGSANSFTDGSNISTCRIIGYWN